jgi:hypothetical protein
MQQMSSQQKILSQRFCSSFLPLFFQQGVYALACVAHLVFFLFCTAQAGAQNNSGSWTILNLSRQQNDHWNFFAEAQLRSLRLYHHFHYYEYKGGFQYKAKPGLTLALGAGRYVTYREGGSFLLPKNNDELRIWPQVILSQSIGRIKTEQRYRLEARFTGSGYRNRFRYRLGLNLPFGKPENGIKPFQFHVSNEIFFTNREPYFERNRFVTFIGYRILPYLSLQAGYVYQFDYRINDETGRQFLQAGLFFDLTTRTNQVAGFQSGAQQE